ncbi:MAG: hypothetical protein HY231_15745 [Acidobacteria bacterium]|nr:hypothetical protein [Acidobacteriota bacterium]
MSQSSGGDASHIIRSGEQRLTLGYWFEIENACLKTALELQQRERPSAQ